MKKYFLKTPAVVESQVRNDSLDNCQAAVEQVDISAATVVPERPAVEEFDETNDINGNDPYHHNSDDDDIGPDNGVASTPVAEVTEEPVKVENKDEAVTQPPTPPAELHEDGDVESSTNSVESTSKYVRFAVTPSHSTTGRGLGTVTERLTREGNSA